MYVINNQSYLQLFGLLLTCTLQPIHLMPNQQDQELIYIVLKNDIIVKYKLNINEPNIIWVQGSYK